MIKRFSEFIDEGWAADSVKRVNGKLPRREDSVIVQSCLGYDIAIHNGAIDYDKIICDILDSEKDGTFSVYEIQPNEIYECEKKNMSYSDMAYTYVMKKYREYYRIYFEDFDPQLFDEDIKEDEYLSMCHAIALKMEELKEYIDTTKSDHQVVTVGNGEFYDYERSSETVLKIMDESEMSHEDFDYESFITDLCNKYNELETENILTWSFNGYGMSIGVVINSRNVIDFMQYKAYADKIKKYYIGL